MFNTLFALFAKEIALIHVSEVAKKISEILELFSEEYLKDQNAKTAAIDAVIQILQQHKGNGP